MNALVDVTARNSRVLEGRVQYRADDKGQRGKRQVARKGVASLPELLCCLASAQRVSTLLRLMRTYAQSTIPVEIEWREKCVKFVSMLSILP